MGYLMWGIVAACTATGVALTALRNTQLAAIMAALAFAILIGACVWRVWRPGPPKGP